MATQQTTDDVEQNTIDFMHGLAASDVDAANISAERTPREMRVHADIPRADSAAASDLAAEYDFGVRVRALPGEPGGATDGDRTRWRFVAEGEA
jgi:hypothetical protein